MGGRAEAGIICNGNRRRGIAILAIAMSGVRRLGHGARTTVLTGLLALVACGPAPQAPATLSHEGASREFEGMWTAAGSRHTIRLGADRRASIANLDGSLLLAGPARPAVGFRAEAIVLNDSATGMVGRAVWTDEHGDQGLQRAARRRHGDRQQDYGYVRRRHGTLLGRHGRLRVLVAIHSRDRGRDRAGPIHGIQGPRAGRWMPATPNPSGSRP